MINFTEFHVAVERKRNNSFLKDDLLRSFVFCDNDDTGHVTLEDLREAAMLVGSVFAENEENMAGF